MGKTKVSGSAKNVTDKLETKLVESAVGGDIDSFGKLCSRYYSSMVAIAYSVLGDHQLAEDAAQEAFARALVNVKNLRGKGKFSPWVAQICRNAAKDMGSGKSRQDISGDFSQQPDRQSDDMDGEAVRQAISKLPVVERELIVLRYYNNLSYERMAGVLGISRAAINGRLYRARRKMAKDLRRNGFPEVQL